MKDNKRTNKKQNYNEEILNILETKYGYSIDYIRKCLRGDRTGIMPDEIVKEYKALHAASKKAIKRAANIKE
jgi:signal recognition particle receptor subunit beta